MSDEATPASAVGSPVVDAIRSLVPEFEEAFRKEFEAEGPGMGAYQAMSLFAEWLGSRIEQSPDGTDVRRAFWVVEEIASSNDYPMGGSLVTEFVEALRNNPRAVLLMGPETLRWA